MSFQTGKICLVLMLNTKEDISNNFAEANGCWSSLTRERNTMKSILQNICFNAPHKTETPTGLGRHEGE